MRRRCRRRFGSFCGAAPAKPLDPSFFRPNPKPICSQVCQPQAGFQAGSVSQFGLVVEQPKSVLAVSETSQLPEKMDRLVPHPGPNRCFLVTVPGGGGGILDMVEKTGCCFPRLLRCPNRHMGLKRRTTIFVGSNLLALFAVSSQLRKLGRWGHFLRCEGNPLKVIKWQGPFSTALASGDRLFQGDNYDHAPRNPCHPPVAFGRSHVPLR